MVPLKNSLGLYLTEILTPKAVFIVHFAKKITCPQKPLIFLKISNSFENFNIFIAVYMKKVQKFKSIIRKYHHSKKTYKNDIWKR